MWVLHGLFVVVNDSYCVLELLGAVIQQYYFSNHVGGIQDIYRFAYVVRL